MKKPLMYTLLTFLLMAERVTMQAQEFSTIPTEQKTYELSVLWKEMSYNFGNIDNCPGLDIDSFYRAFLPKVRLSSIGSTTRKFVVR